MILSHKLSAFIIILCSVLISSCAAIGGIFEAGMGVGIFAVLALLVLVAFIIMKLRKK